MLQVTYPFRKEFFGGIAYNRFSTRGGYIYLNDAAYDLLNFIDSNLVTRDDVLAHPEFSIQVEHFIKAGYLQYVSKKTSVQRCVDSLFLSHDRLSSPVSVDLYPAFHCNYRCGFCFVGDWIESPGKSIFSESDIDSLVSSISKSGIFHVGILGGEPLLYKNIEFLIDRLYHTGIHLSLATNGTVCKDTIINKLVECNVDVNVSVQGHDSNIHGQVVGNSKSFDKVCQFIQMLREVDKSFLLSIVVNRLNCDSIDLFIEWCASVGATDVTLFFPERSEYTTRNDMNFEFRDYLRVLRSAKEVGARFGLKVDSNCHFDFLIRENLGEFDIANPLSPFLYGDKAFSSKVDVMPNGDVYPNHEFFGLPQFKLGNVFTSSIHEAWNSNIFDGLALSARTIPKACTSCDFKDICRGGFLSRKVKNGMFLDRPEYCPLIDEGMTFSEANAISF